jgi:hypothetical protein
LPRSWTRPGDAVLLCASSSAGAAEKTLDASADLTVACVIDAVSYRRKDIYRR